MISMSQHIYAIDDLMKVEIQVTLTQEKTKLEINMHHLPKAMQYRQATCRSD